MDLNNRPQLPDVIPQGNVTVENEEHLYKEFETDSGTDQKYEYTLNKSPIIEIERVTGIDENQNSRTFNKGVDYKLSEKVESKTEVFTYTSDLEGYELVDEPDPQSISIVDESGNTYSEPDDFTVVNPDGAAEDTVIWNDNVSRLKEEEKFTVSYETTYENSVIKWQTDGNNLPNPNSKFYVTYRAPSIVSRYLDASEEKLHSIEDEITNVIEGKFIESASGQELDEIGKLFGPLIGKRRGRDDESYRIYLKSVVQSFVSRGTVNGIKLAVSAATDVPIEDITIKENFEDTSYSIIVIAKTPVTASLLGQIAEIADPSGVEQLRTRFTLDTDEMLVKDDIDINPNKFSTSDSMSTSDSTSNFGFGTRGKVFDTTLSDDDVLIDQNKFSTSDSVSSDDAVTSEQNKVSWDETNWNETDWASENN